MAVVRCKTCRFVLCTDTATDTVPHSDRPTQTVGFKPTQTCSHIFLTQQPWMQSQVEGGVVEGTLYCGGRCGGKVGNFNWAGWPCACGHWVVPAFAVIKSKVDVL